MEFVRCLWVVHVLCVICSLHSVVSLTLPDSKTASSATAGLGSVPSQRHGLGENAALFLARRSSASADGSVAKRSSGEENDDVPLVLSHVSRQRRQAGSGAVAASGNQSQAIRDLRALLRPFFITNVDQCTTLFDDILSQCVSIVGRILTEQLTNPVVATREAYRNLSQNCPTLPTSCGVNCSVLSATLASLEQIFPVVRPTVALQVEAICDITRDNLKRFPATPLVVGLARLVETLGVVANPRTLVADLACARTEHISDIAAQLLHELPVLANTVQLYTALRNYTASMQLVQFELPYRLYRAYGHLAQGALAAAADQTYVNATISYILCSSVYPSASVRPCPWLCRNISELFLLASMFPQQSANASTPLMDLLADLRDSCVNTTSNWTTCGDVSCPPNSFCVPIEKGRDESSMSTSQQATVRAQQRGYGVCFNASCPFPLRATNNSAHWEPSAQDVLRAGFRAADALLDELNMTFDGSALPCGLDCVTFTFGKEDEKTAMIVVGVFSWTLFLINSFALLTFYVNRVRLNKYPTKVLLYVNACSMISNVATLIQFFTDSRSYVCFDDNTLRQHEPNSSSDNGSRTCTFIFILLFYFLLASLFWWLALAHAWYVTFTELDKQSFLPEKGKRYMRFYHVVAWIVPAVLTAIALGKRYIDGFPLIGMCFTNNVDSLFSLLSVPIVVVGLLGLPFLVCGSFQLLAHNKTIKSMKNHRRISQRTIRNQAGLRNFLVKLMIIMIMSFINLLVQFAVGLFMRVSWKRWRQEIQDHLTCLLTRCNPDDTCPPLPDPNLVPFLLIPITIILEGLVLCFWAFTRDTWQTWKKTELVRRASSLPVFRNLTTRTDKPGIAGITAAQKAARHIHLKASARREQAAAANGNGTSTSAPTSYWDATATAMTGMSVQEGGGLESKPLEHSLADSSYQDGSTAKLNTNGNGNGSSPKARPGTTRSNSSRVTLNLNVAVTTIPASSNVGLETLPCSPGGKRKDAAPPQQQIPDIADKTPPTSPPPKSCLKNNTASAVSTSPASNPRQASKVGVATMESSPQSRRRALQKLTSDLDMDSPVQSPVKGDGCAELPESPRSRRRPAPSPSPAVSPPTEPVSLEEIPVANSQPLHATDHDGRGSSPSSMKYAMSGSPMPLLPSQNDVRSASNFNSTAV